MIQESVRASALRAAPLSPARARIGARLGIAVAASIVLVSTPVRAEDRNLRPIYDYVVEVDGKVDKGWQAMAGEQRSRLFLLAPGGGTVVLVSVPDKSVRAVDRSLILKHPDGSLDVLAGAVSSSLMLPLTVNGAEASFAMQGSSITLKPRPPLLGPHSVEELVQDRPNFGQGIRSYQPDASIVSFLKGYQKQTEIEIFFGSWCPVCENWVPKFLKSVEVSGNSKIQVRLIGVSRDFSNDQNLAKQKGIRGLPTFIIRQDGVEVGRIVGAPREGTVEAAVADVLKAKS